MVQKLNNGNAIVNDDGTLDLGSGTLDGSEGGFTAVNFSVHRNDVDQADVVTGTWTKVLWTTEEWDVGGYFADSKFIPPAGKYSINANVSVLSLGDTKIGRAAIYKNAALYKMGVEVMGKATTSEASVDCDIIADGDDEFEIYVHHDHGANRDVRGLVDWTYFQGHRIE